MGMCVAGGAYLPVMCDHILMTEGSGLFLAGPALVQRQSAKNFAERSRRRENAFANSGTVDFASPMTTRASLEFAHSLTRSARQSFAFIIPRRASPLLFRRRNLRNLFERFRQAV